MLDRIEVVDCKTWCEFARQETGTDYYYQSSYRMVGVHAKKFFGEYPDATWADFAAVILWAKSRPTFKPVHVGALASCWPYAVKDGFFKTKELHGFDVDAMLYDALAFEKEDSWRRRLLGGVGNLHAEQVYTEWKDYRSRLDE